MPHIHTQPHSTSPSFAPLQGIRILSLALNLPGPAALMRCQQMGASCSKLEPIAPSSLASADPMQHYSPDAYAQLHQGVTLLQANLKTPEGQTLLHTQLACTDVLLTSFRPSALDKLGLTWEQLHAQHPQLCMVRIYGSTQPASAEHAGHDLTYQAQAGLLKNGQMPTSLLADMAGATMASEAILQTLLLRAQSGGGHCHDIGLEQAAHWLALPIQWGMTTANGDVGGAHAGYRMYRCTDGWVAIAALEPHFAKRLCQAAGMTEATGSVQDMRNPDVHSQLETWLQRHSCAEISAIAAQSDIPLQAINGPYK
jgi:alpha-methylacyl-CoA racemase